jgi:hypothetical protein
VQIAHPQNFKRVSDSLEIQKHLQSSSQAIRTDRKMLAECERIDECQDWANKAEALASYARQMNDDELRLRCDRIQARAIHRAGELLAQIEPGQGNR